MKINRDSRVRTAYLSKEAGVRRYILYARANEMAEQGVLPLADERFCVVVLRQATVYGLSPRMRFDLAINGMTFGAWKTGPPMRDGTQWQPMVHVRDTARAQMFMLEAHPTKVTGQIFNVGSADNTYQIGPLAAHVAAKRTAVRRQGTCSHTPSPACRVVQHHGVCPNGPRPFSSRIGRIAAYEGLACRPLVRGG